MFESFFLSLSLSLLLPANVVCEGYFVFTGVCLSGGCYPSMPCSRSRGVVSQHALQVSRSTPKGEVEGDLVQVHSQGGRGGCSRGVVETPPVTATAAGGTHPT